MKIAINTCYGGFSLSNLAVKMAVDAGLKLKSYKYVPREDDVKADFGDGWAIYNREGSSSDVFSRLVKGDRVYSCHLNDNDKLRGDPILIKVIEKLGEKANGFLAEIKIVKIPNNVKYYIHEYDGMEEIHEIHRSWS